MKLLIATHSLAGLAGAPLHSLDLCRGFRRAGHDVSVFAFHLGKVAEMLEGEGFPVYSLQNYRSLDREKGTFDLVYLFHATCEALVGLMFVGQVPIVRGYIGKGGAIANPIAGNFSSAATYISEGVKETMDAMVGQRNIPSLIARNVYDDRQTVRGAAPKGSPVDQPNFAIVSNHIRPELGELLETAAKKGLCRFTHFGYPHNSVPITSKLLAPFDAVITVGRSVLLATASGKPVYLCDVHGVEGWLRQQNYSESRRHSFSGRLDNVEDKAQIERQLLDTSQWPSVDELAWLRDRVEEDHALTRRVESLADFFADIVEKAPAPVPVPNGYRAVFRLVSTNEQDSGMEPGRRRRRQEAINKLKAAEAELEAQSSRIRKLESQLRKGETR